MTLATPQRSAASAAAPWVVALVLLLAALVAYRGRTSTARVPEGALAVSAEPERPRAASAPPASAPAHADADVPAPAPTPINDADVVELRGRKLPIPVEGVAAAMLVPTFHQARGEHEHEALDILAPRGTAVIAVEDGRIAKLFTSVRGGLTIYLFDPAGVYCYYYAHLDQYAERLHDGQDVVRGEVIGYVGTTGNAPPNTPHLHFAVFKLGPEKHWWQGTAIDPYLIWR